MLTKYIIAGLGVALLAALTATVVQTRRLNTAREDIAVLESQVQDKDSLIDMQTKGIVELEKAEAERLVAMKAAGIKIADLNAQLDAARTKRNAPVEKDYALPDCRTLLETDIARVCPAHAGRLRDAAQDR